jgi:hypothetical protein
VKRLIALFVMCSVVFVTSLGCGGDTAKKDSPKASPPAEKKDK